MHLCLLIIAEKRVALVDGHRFEEFQPLVIHLPPEQQLAVCIHITIELVDHRRVKERLRPKK